MRNGLAGRMLRIRISCCTYLQLNHEYNQSTVIRQLDL
jgi:hypothetical protein